MDPTLITAGMSMLQNVNSATEPPPQEAPDYVTITPTLTGGGPMSVSFGGSGSNWMLILGIIFVVYFLSRGSSRTART